MKKHIYILMLFLLCFAFAKAQSEKAALEERKAEIQNEINQFDRLLKNVRKEEKTMVLLVETIDKKISRTQEIINITNKQANTLTRNIKANLVQIKKLEVEIKALKAEYAEMIVKAYKSKNDQSRLMFLLSSEDFLQAYKRVQYLQSYANYRKKQADEILLKSTAIADKNEELESEKKEKSRVLDLNQRQRAALKTDKVEQVDLLAVVKANEKKYAADIKEKSRERNKIDSELRALIAADIKASNKGKTGAVANKFFLTPEAKLLANNFKSNKGKLPWPVEEGFVSRRYGKQPHPVVRSLTIDSNGLRMQSPEGAKVRSIFEGKVIRITKSKYGILAVHIRHGNYTSIYDNLKLVSVETGDTVRTKDIIGEIFTSNSGETELKFVLMQDTETVDPAQWIARK
ncbi:peptidoglycan DD-metalloendopeptidase family protein [uncultured Nonlabens sp.]|uniref:murein hydrolase activator EnvC family protein n=1 Tax=uncultured Nonlabens sp. TaxID=859306 RepID=UPI0030D8DBAB|tara:strand:- start:9637 stop:10842 length:1206 start_codon:yes stop_codon:yes gene_type:complete